MKKKPSNQHKRGHMHPETLLKSIARVLMTVILTGSFQMLFAQQAPAVPDTSKMNYNQISAGLGVYVFPAKKQSPQRQKEDEFECYKWAMEQSGIDPLNLPKTQVQAQTGPTGGAVKGSAKGAAAGVAIGAIAGDAGKGAAIGAVAGGVAGRRQGKQAQSQANQQAQANATANDKALKDSFIKGFTACLEGKGYTTK